MLCLLSHMWPLVLIPSSAVFKLENCTSGTSKGLLCGEVSRREMVDNSRQYKSRKEWGYMV